MDRFFDRLGEFLRGVLDGETHTGGTGDPAQDPFMRDAYAELDEYLRTGRSRPRPAMGGQRGEPRRPARPPEELRRDYANLEVAFGASFVEVRQAHRRLLRQYHPDRFGRDARKQHLATEITQKLNESFQRIQSYARGADRGD
jgi:DnaJ-domain-containing protein 1